MATVQPKTERISIRIPEELKREVEEAATQTGQSLSEFAIATLLDRARAIAEQTRSTRLTNTDRDLFLAMLDDTSTKPNKALVAAAKKYKKQRG